MLQEFYCLVKLQALAEKPSHFLQLNFDFAILYVLILQQKY